MESTEEQEKNSKNKCPHGKYKCNCRECNKKAFCEHDRKKNYCKECKGSALCIHLILKGFCEECDGKYLCEHRKRKCDCRECSSRFCEHGVRKDTCKKCHGSGICEHGVNGYYCKDCDGAGICTHGIKKARCKECGGSNLCQSSWCETRASPNYGKYCAFCYFNLFPDDPRCRNYKTKEKCIVDAILETFPNFTWTTDKKIQDGCSKKRPDMFLDMGFQVIIVEVDENQHATYDTTCENKRLMELSQDVGHKPIVFIRFNPDSYEENGEKIKSCWKAKEQSGIMIIDPKKKEEWNERIKTLKKIIKYWTKNETTKTVEVVKLFYDTP